MAFPGIISCTASVPSQVEGLMAGSQADQMRAAVRRVFSVLVGLALLTLLGITGCEKADARNADAQRPSVKQSSGASPSSMQRVAEGPSATKLEAPPKSAENSTSEGPRRVPAEGSGPTALPSTGQLDGEFEPPFGHRVELFEPVSDGKAPARSDGLAGGNLSSVALKGFVNADGPRAVLHIGGVLAAVAEGQTRDGIEVISIDPPQVTLQRGRVRWTESLYGQQPSAQGKTAADGN